MPKKIKLEDGTEQTVYTQEELDEQKSNLETSHKEEIEKIKTENNPNWGEARQKLTKHDKLMKSLKDKNIEVDDEGNVKLPPEQKQKQQPNEQPKGLTEEEAKKIADNQYFTRYRNNQLLNLSEEDREKVIDKYNKLSAGEEISSEEDVLRILKDSVTIVNPDMINNQPEQRSEHIRPTPPLFGDAPRGGSEKPEFSKTEEGQVLGSALFGDKFVDAPEK